MSFGIPDADLRVPDGETPAQCPHCGRPFRTERLRNLHVGDAHDDDWTDGEQAAYESAMEAEREDLFIYHLKVVASLVAVYAFFFFTYLAVSMIQA